MVLSMSARLWTLLGVITAATAMFIYSRTQSGATVVENILGATGDKGFRLNNPGNIMQSSVTYDGEVQPSSDPYEKQFSSFDYGLRAIAVAIKAYYNLHQLDTIDGLIRRYSATDQDAYVANVAAIVGVDPHDNIDPTDPSTLALIVRGIVRQENGIVLSAGVPDSQIANAVTAS
jgi:hypothetical protein